MKKRVIILHGWQGNPDEAWFPWLKGELEAKGFYVTVPQLPEPDFPTIQNWIPAISKVVGTPDEQTYFVGHSLGCIAIVRYLETLPKKTKVGGTVFVAGFLKTVTGYEINPQVQEIDKHWLQTPLNAKLAATHLPKSIAIFSDNDPWVPLENQEDFREKLNSEIIVMQNMGHFSGSANIFELPIALESLFQLAR